MKQQHAYYVSGLFPKISYRVHQVAHENAVFLSSACDFSRTFSIIVPNRKFLDYTYVVENHSSASHVSFREIYTDCISLFSTHNWINSSKARNCRRHTILRRQKRQMKIYLTFKLEKLAGGRHRVNPKHSRTDITRNGRFPAHRHHTVVISPLTLAWEVLRLPT